MEKYIGNTTVTAEKITRGDFFTRRGLRLPDDEAYFTMGYRMICVNYSPDMWYTREEFEKQFRPMDSMDFGMALASIREGFEVERRAWFGVVRGHLTRCEDPERLILRIDHGIYKFWEPSMEDILAKDWRVCK